MIALAVNWLPEDQAWLLAAQNRRGSFLGITGAQFMVGSALAALAAPLAGRLAAWAMNPGDPTPLLRLPAWDDAVVVGGIIGTAFVMTLLSLRLERLGLRAMLDARAAEGREPLVGPVTVTLGPDRVTLRGASWDFAFDAALLTRIEEPPGYLILRFGPARPAMLPRRDLTAPEAAAVRDWAAGVLRRSA